MAKFIRYDFNSLKERVDLETLAIERYGYEPTDGWSARSPKLRRQRDGDILIIRPADADTADGFFRPRRGGDAFENGDALSFVRGMETEAGRDSSLRAAGAILTNFIAEHPIAARAYPAPAPTDEDFARQWTELGRLDRYSAALAYLRDRRGLAIPTDRTDGLADHIAISTATIEIGDPRQEETQILDFKNIAFAHRDRDGRICGWETRGIPNRHFRRVRWPPWRLFADPCRRTPAARMVVVESAIDALSARELDQMRGHPLAAQTEYISTAGTPGSAAIAEIQAAMASGRRVELLFDRDKPGGKHTAHILTACPGTVDIRAEFFAGCSWVTKDPNDALRDLKNLPRQDAQVKPPRPASAWVNSQEQDRDDEQEINY